MSGEEEDEEEAESSEEEGDEEEEGGAEDGHEDEDYAELTKFHPRRSSRTAQADQYKNGYCNYQHKITIFI